MNPRLIINSMVALSLFSACSAGTDISGDEVAGAGVSSETVDGDARSIHIAAADGSALDVDVGYVENSEAGSYAEVEVDGRAFEIAQWYDAESSALHNVVSAVDGSLRYETIIDASGARLVLSDAAGQRTIESGQAMGNVDDVAATLLMNLRAPDAEDEMPYSYRTVCITYDTSNPDDWYLKRGWCTCAHWYSLICTMD